MVALTGLLFGCALGLASTPPSPTESQASASTPAAPRPFWRRIGGFVGLEWRLLGVAGHVSHGPGFQAGAIFFDHLKVGLAGVARPGPINPKTFAFSLPDGQTYKGQSTLQLRSDGNVIGFLVAPMFDLRRAPLSIELPLLIGYAGFGFYLHGSDRDVPDNRRVSEWEDDLLAGRDSDPANLAIDIGIRLAFIPRRTDYVRPYLGIHYLFVPGFDTTVRDNYDGASGVVGVQFGKFPRRR